MARDDQNMESTPVKLLDIRHIVMKPSEELSLIDNICNKKMETLKRLHFLFMLEVYIPIA